MAILEPYAAPTFPRLAAHVHGCLQTGHVVALPTETYYGLAVNPFDTEAIERLFRVKEREDRKPILVLIGERRQLGLLTEVVSPAATFLMETFWPGPLTLLFPAQPSLPSILTAGSGKVAVRLSSCAPLVDLLKSVGPVTGTSANRSGEPPAQTAQDVLRALGNQLALIVDAGPTPGGPPSTLVDPDEPVQLIREGAISRQMLQNVLQTRGISLL